ncbi:YopX family protein [Patescibacteria group bacterium]
MKNRFIFRVWHKGKKHMYENVAVGVGENKIGFKISGKKRYVWEDTSNIVVNQCTGYTDNNGNNIFDGDILKFGKTNSYNASVHWEDYKFIFRKNGSTKDLDKFATWGKIKHVKIIGNVYENPELLKD